MIIFILALIRDLIKITSLLTNFFMSSTEQGLNLEAISQEIDQEKGGLRIQNSGPLMLIVKPIPDLRKQEELFLKNEADELLLAMALMLRLINEVRPSSLSTSQRKIENFDKLIKSIDGQLAEADKDPEVLGK